MPAIGVVLAGGRGRRMGGSGKALVPLAGQALIEWPLQALREAGLRCVVVAKRDSELPDGIEVWHEPDQPRHPRTGLIEALRRAGGEPILVCPLDLPGVRARDVRRLLEAPAELVALAEDSSGRLQPLLGRYEPAALEVLENAPRDESLTAAALRMDPTRIALADDVLLNVNEPADLEAAFSRRSPTSSVAEPRSPARRRDA